MSAASKITIMTGMLWAVPAFAQVAYDPPTAIRPAPNVMVLLDNTRTTSINGSTCRGLCHVENSCGGHGGEWDCNIYKRGETRMQLARRVLTGGYGWNTAVIGPDAKPADAQVRTDGVMDVYKVRWGVSIYDGISARLAIDPSSDNLAVQKAVIDYGQTPNDWYGPGGPPGLNSFVVYPRTTQCCGNYDGAPWNKSHPTRLPWWTEMDDCTGRQSKALQWMADYWDARVDAKRWTPKAGGTATQPMFFPSSVDPEDEEVIDNDIANTMVTLGAGGCRRNFTIMMLDGHGGGSYDGLTNGEAAGKIVNLPHKSGTPLPIAKRNQVFAIHFGVADKPNADRIADWGWDGMAGGAFPGIFQAFEGAPGGAITDLSPMLAAFSAIFQLVLAGDYVGAAPTVSRLGDHLAKTHFTIRDCTGVPPDACNIGRPGYMEWVPLNPDGSMGGLEWDAGLVLRSRLHTDRSLYTTMPKGHGNAATETNCGTAATCATKSALLASVVPGIFGAVANFVRGDPFSQFANGVLRGDGDGDGAVDDPFKLTSVANSRPVIVGAPPGIGRDLERWHAFRERSIKRIGAHGGNGSSVPVKERDQVIYLGGNDGFLHAFLAGRASGTVPKGQAVAYEPFGSNCPTNGGPAQSTNSMCNGMELWGYSPRMIQKNWPTMRGGHIYMVDGTPVVADVLFTKNKASPGLVCSSYPCGTSKWEYRTVLVECLGSGGPGCFALDVTNPWDPQLLWEREFTSILGKGTSTSRPVIARVKRIVAGKAIPYHVALMGGGSNEADAAGKKGTFIAVGIEDGDLFTSPTTADADFAGEPSCLDVDGDSYVDTCYILTSEASIYKIRLGDGDPNNMSMVRFFNGRHGNASNNSDILSFTKVIATPTTDNKLALFFATGNIEDVPDSKEKNFLFKIRDLNPLSMASWTPSLNATRQADACTNVPPGLTKITEGTLRLDTGEKVLFNPWLVSGTVMFTSYLPPTNPCLDGRGFLYGVRYDTCDEGLDTTDNGEADEEKVDLGDGLPGEVTANYSTGDTYVAVSDNTVVTNPGKPPANEGFRMLKLFWRELF